jgi:hyperosmotically inducible protein
MRRAMLASLLLIVAACAGAPSTERQFGDALIAERVRTALSNDAELAGYPITVNVREGRVTLTGTVGSQAQVERAGRVAETVADVRGVENLLSVRR